MNYASQRMRFANPFGFGSYQDPGGGWHPTPLIQFVGESFSRNPVNGATYANEDEANAATGPHSVTTFQNRAEWDAYLATFGGDIYAALLKPPTYEDVPPPPQPPPSQRPSDLRPDLAVIVRGFYERYLHRSGAQVDEAGLEFWVQVIINDGAAGLENAERGFRVQAVNDGVFTAATLPAPQYFSLGVSEPAPDPVPVPYVPPPSNGDRTGGGITTPPAGTNKMTDTTEVGFLANIENTISDLFERAATATGINKSYLELGAVAVVIGGLVWANSSEGRKPIGGKT